MIFFFLFDTAQIFNNFILFSFILFFFTFFEPNTNERTTKKNFSFQHLLSTNIEDLYNEISLSTCTKLWKKIVHLRQKKKNIQKFKSTVFFSCNQYKEHLYVCHQPSKNKYKLIKFFLKKYFFKSTFSSSNQLQY